MALDAFRERLNRLPVGVAVAVFGLILAVAIWVGVAHRGSEASYETGDFHMKCSKCGHTEVWSAKKYESRLESELPGAEVMKYGARFKCPNCGAEHAFAADNDEQETAEPGAKTELPGGG